KLPKQLEKDEFLTVIRLAPLVAIDLLIENDKNQILVALRRNPPAKGWWFVPGGRIYKNERIPEAFQRITLAEVGVSLRIEQTVFHGVFDHIYADNFAGVPGFGTHYVNLAYRVKFTPDLEKLPETQHSDYRWMDVETLLVSPEVHANMKAYFLV
ncbi:MAG TPA: GDP-mannose mannosyl hydrolase, partial [Longilinea sp.]|nr:GDP-mannose mannosyl hydrolase [Longilinea sp.]